MPVLCSVLSARAHAQAGPPFRTDDPETPGNKHWEINFGWIGDRNRASGAYQVPDFDINYGLGDRIQLKYEIPIAIQETRALPQSPASPDGQEGVVLGGLGESLLGIKWRFYEHHLGDTKFHGRFGTGLLSVFGHNAAPKPAEPASASGDSPGAIDSPEQVLNFSVGTYPQLFLDNPTGSVPRGIVGPGPQFYLPLEANARIGPIRIDAEVGYNFGNRTTPQSWNRGIIVGHEFSDRTEAYVEFYDTQQANRIAAGQGVGNFATGSIEAARTHARPRRQASDQSRKDTQSPPHGRPRDPANSRHQQPATVDCLRRLPGPAQPQISCVPVLGPHRRPSHYQMLYGEKVIYSLTGFENPQVL